MTWLALDIGGANLKAADGRGYAASRPFALWRTPERLGEEAAALIAHGPRPSRIAVTMTGELADCYATKAEGVAAILDSVERACDDLPAWVYLTDGRFATIDECRAQLLLAAASNWHALATFACRFAPGGLLADLGSTTADVIPLGAAGPATDSRDDLGRLLRGELVYTGIKRTPVAAVVGRLPWRGQSCPVATELFATTVDAYTMLGELPEQPDDRDTADGRPRTRADSRARLARMICSDATAFADDDALAAAAAIRDAQAELIRAAISEVVQRMKSPPGQVVLSGHGEFLLRPIIERQLPGVKIVSLNRELGDEASRCAPAHALAVLAQERMPEAGAMIRVVKLGGSLLDLPGLPAKLQAWLALQPPAHHVLIVGGGPLVEHVRAWHARTPMDEAAVHWMCVDLMSVTAQLVHAWLPELHLTDGLDEVRRRAAEPGVTLLATARWLQEAESRQPGTTLRCDWSTTSDAIAGRLAIVLWAQELVLLKSTLPPSGEPLELVRLARGGYVDAMLADLAAELPPTRIVDFRQVPPAEASASAVGLEPSRGPHPPR